MTDLDPKGPSRRLEWISLVYLLFFVFAVMTPSLVVKDYFGIPEHHIEEVLIFLFGLGGLATFTVYERLMERRVKERDDAVQNAERAMKELVESYRYIGSVNRQIDVLKKHVSQTSLSLTDKRAYWKDLLTSLAANAAASANASRVLIRFVELDKLRTDREVYHYLQSKKPIKVSNRELKQVHSQGITHAFLKTEDGENLLVVPSDKNDEGIRAYLLLVIGQEEVSSLEVSLIKVFANQAELIYHNLIRKAPADQQLAPLDRVDEVTNMTVGEVS